MSSSEEYLDSLLDSILSGGKSDEGNSAAEESQAALGDDKAADAGKAMSPDEIEEMLMSMGTLGGGEEDSQEQDSAEDMEAMLAFMDEHSADDAGVADELSLDGLDIDGSGMDDSALEGMSLDDLSLEETDDGASDALGDLSLDDFSLEETDDSALDTMDGLSLDDLGMEEGGMDDSAMDELSLDDLGLDDLSLGQEDDGASDALDALSLGDLDMGESGSDDSDMDGLFLDDSALDDLSLDGFSSEGSENTEEDEDALMSEEDIDRLLSGDMSEEAENDFALEETGEAEGDDDLSALLAGMEHDEDLSEINDLLEESDQGISADDDMLAMLEGVDEDAGGSFDLFESDEAAREAESIRELSPEEAAAREGGDQGKKEKKKRKKLFGKKKKGGEEEEGAEATEAEAEDELEALLGEVSAAPAAETSKKEKKPGFFTKLLDFLLESEEDDDPVAAEVLSDNDGEMGMVTDENKALLQELSDEDKKGKKKKKKKDKKGKKGKDGEEDDKKAKKEKKPKKVKQKKEKPKKDEEVDLLAPPSKPLSKKKVITVFVFCATIAVGIIVFATILPDTMQKKEAQTAYDQGNYAEVYDLLYGKELDEQDKVLFQGSNLVLQMQRKLSSYDNYVNLDMRPEALNALITGVARYQRILPEAENYNVVVEVNDIYAQILDRLAAFGLSEQDALDLLALDDDVIYTQRLNAIINGESYDDGEEDVEVGVQDMLPEEEEIMERIGGVDGEMEVVFEPEDILPEEDTLPEEDVLPEEEMLMDQADGESLDEGAE